MKILPTILFFLFFVQRSIAQSPIELHTIFEVAGQDSGARLGQYVKGVGDLNKDSYADVAVSAPGEFKTYVYFGGKTMSQTPSLIFEGGGSIVSGDFNSDGWIDLAIEKWASNLVYIYFGGPQMDTIADLILVGESMHDGFGSSMAVGDINGDGIDDLIISAPNYLDSTSNNKKISKIYVFEGGSNFNAILKATINGDSIRAGFGEVVVGDVNNDGKKDIIALGLNTMNPNANYWFYYISVFLGDSSFQLKRNYYIDSRNIPGGFQDHIACFDADGDGIDDILVNKIYIFKGGAKLDTFPTYYIAPPDNDTLNYGPYPWVSGGGDYNHDGVKDILLSSTQGYYGGVPGVSVMFDRRNHPGQFMAYRIFSDYWWISPLYGTPENAGDVNGDGVDDIITSAPYQFMNYEGFFGIYSGDTSLVTEIKNKRVNRIENFELNQNYPNPFNPSTTIEYSLLKKEKVTIKIYDSIGREVATLVNNEEQTEGKHKIQWRGTDKQGNCVSSGVYYYRLATSSGASTKKAIYLK